MGLGYSVTIVYTSRKEILSPLIQVNSFEMYDKKYYTQYHGVVLGVVSDNMSYAMTIVLIKDYRVASMRLYRFPSSEHRRFFLTFQCIYCVSTGLQNIIRIAYKSGDSK